MTQIESIDFPRLLSEPVKAALKKHQIITAIDFLNHDAQKLADLTKSALKDIDDLKSYIHTQYGGKRETGYEIYENIQRTTIPFKTGIKSFDKILGAGLLSGNLYEICGLSAAGKTQLCQAISLNLLINYDVETLFIDTHQNFCATRLWKMLEANGFAKDDICRHMRRIICERCYSVDEFLNVLAGLAQQNEVTNRLKLIVVDSMPALWLMYQGQYIQTGLKLLSVATNLMRKLAVEQQKTFLLVNLVTRWNSSDFGKFECRNSADQTACVPALGKHWLSVPSTRFYMKRLDSQNVKQNSTVSDRIIEIVKSDQYKCGSYCCVTINDKGVV